MDFTLDHASDTFTMLHPDALCADAPFETLTNGELRVLQMLVAGASNRQIAGRAQISENTVKFHLKNVYGKLGVGNRLAAAQAAVQHGLVTPA